jgi:hypothetical protein
MFSRFKYETIPLGDIILDDRNPRIVTQSKLSSQPEILQYLFDYENLLQFTRKIASEGKNIGAERPYVVKTNGDYTVVEGNQRIAAYKLLSGLLQAPDEYADSIPEVSRQAKELLMKVDCAIAPSRDALLPIVANAHFGLGDKSKWGYLGSRKAVFDEWKLGKKVSELAKAFDRTKGQIQELIIEYELYLEALNLGWTASEKEVLLNPSVEFNPPVRFLQSHGHKEKVGVGYDFVNLRIKFADGDAKQRFRHLVKKLVIHPEKKLGATASLTTFTRTILHRVEQQSPPQRVAARRPPRARLVLRRPVQQKRPRPNGARSSPMWPQ